MTKEYTRIEKMFPKILQLAALFLDKASEEFSNNGCNDLYGELDVLTQQELVSFIKEYHEWNGDPEEFDPEYLSIADFAVMSFLAYKLRSYKIEEI